MESSRQVRAGALVLVAIWVSVFTIAIGLRTANAPVALRDGLPHLLPADDLYHAKRILHTLDHYPAVLQFDPDRNVTGAYCPWPPLWDFSIATLLKVAGLSGIEAIAAAAWLAPLIGAMFAAALAVLVARRLGGYAGLVAGLGVGLPMPLIFISQLARLDHQVIEGPLMVAIAAATASLVADREERFRARHALLLALSLCAALFVQTALLAGAGIAFAALLALAANRFRLLEGASAYAVAAVAVYAYRLTLPGDYPTSAWFLGTPHALVLATAAGALLLAANPALVRRAPLVRGIAASIPPALLLVTLPAIRSILGEGGGFFRGDRWFSTIDEFRPFFDNASTAWLDALVLAPIAAAVVLAIRSWRDDSRGRLALAVCAIAYGVLAITSRRLIYVAAPLAAVAGAIVFGDLLRFGKKRAAAVVATLVVLAPALATFVYLPGMRHSPGIQTEAMIRAAIALRAQPAQGRVLAPWDRGHLIWFYSGRPAVVDNFGSTGKRGELEAAAAALLSTDDDALARYCRERSIAFIVLNHPIEQLAATATIAGFDGSRYATGKGWIEPGPDAKSTFWWRAYFAGDRSRLAGVPLPGAVRGFRLVWSDEMDVAYAFGMRGAAAQIWAVE